MGSRIDELDAIVRSFDLNEHPFYTEWRAGTLPVERLAEYADEWAPFIGAVDAGWEPDRLSRLRRRGARARRAVGQLPRRARRDRRDASVRSRRPCSPSASTRSLGPEALGALYSFEVQQPATASGKLAGLREHYAGTVDAAAQQYFVEHAVETDEPAMLAARIDALSDGEFARAKTACALFSAAAWGASTGSTTPTDGLGARGC